MFLAFIAGCGESKDEKIKKQLQVAKQLISSSNLSDTETIKYGEVSSEVLNRIASLKIEASRQQVQVIEKLYTSYSNLEMWAKAKQALDELIRLQPTNSEWYIEKGRVLSKWSKVDDSKIEPAEQAFKTALEIDPKSLMARYGLGILYGFRMNEINRARRHFKEVINTKPLRAKHIGKVIDARFALAKMEFENGNLQTAETVYRDLLNMKSVPRDSKFQTYKNLGQVYSEMGSRDMSKRMYKKAYNIYPENSSVRNALRNLGVEIKDRFTRFESSQ